MPRVRGRKGTSRFLTSPPTGWRQVDAGPVGASLMTRLVIFKVTRDLPAAAATPIWRRGNGTSNGWVLDLNNGLPRARIGGQIGLSTATGALAPAVGKWHTVCLSTVSVGEGRGAAIALDGAAFAAGGSFGITYTAPAGTEDTFVGLDSASPTVAASQLDIIALLGSDTVALNDAQYAVAHAAIIDAVQQGRVLTGMFTGQDVLFDGRDVGSTVDVVTGLPTWVAQQGAFTLTTLTSLGPPEYPFSAARF